MVRHRHTKIMLGLLSLGGLLVYGSSSPVSAQSKGTPTKSFPLTISTTKTGFFQVKPTKPIELLLEKGKASVQGKITANDGRDQDGKYYKIYSFRAVAGKIYSFEARGKLDPYLRMEDNAGGRLKDEDDGDIGFSRLNFLPTKTATYHLIVSSINGDKTGDFALSASEFAPKAAKVTPLAVDKTKSVAGKLTKDDGIDHEGKFFTVYTFRTEKGKVYRFEATGKMDPYLRLEDKNSKFIKNEDDGSPGFSRLLFLPNEAETYRLIVTSDRSGKVGDFTLSTTVTPFTEPALQPATVFQTVKQAKLTGSVTKDDGINAQGQYYKAYSFKTEAGKLYRFELSCTANAATPPPVDPLFPNPNPLQPGMPAPPRQTLLALRLHDGNGKEVQKTVAITQGTAELAYQAPTTSEHRLLVVAEKFAAATSFSVKITEGPAGDLRQPKVASITFQPVKVLHITTSIGDADGIDFQGRPQKIYPIKLEAGKMYRIEASSEEVPVQLELKDDTGKLIKLGSVLGALNAFLIHKAVVTGDYRLAVSAERVGSKGRFTLSVTESEPVPPKVEALTLVQGKPTAVSGKLTTDDSLDEINKFHKTYTFKAAAGKTYRIDLHSTAFDAYLYLKDATGKTLMENDDNGESLDSRIIYKFGNAGTYQIIATSLGGFGTGDYVLTITEADALDMMQMRLQNGPGLVTAKDRERFLDEFVQHLKDHNATAGLREANLAMRFASSLEFTDKKLAQEAYSNLGKVLVDCDNPQAFQIGKRMMAVGKRLGLLGQSMDLKGKTITGENIDLAKLKGQVVLVDFWASWCIPCREEIPNIKKMYKKYHAKGFEVIGVSRDDIQQEFNDFMTKDKLPWPCIYDRDAPLDQQVGEQYGIVSIPTAILIDREGRVVSMNARGAELERLLDKYFDEK